MRIAFVGHSYHLTTGSSGFLLELLRRAGEVETFYDESWLTGAHAGWAAELRAEEFDCVVVFQAPEPMLWLDTRHPNLAFVPMLDGHLADGRFWWREEFSAAKIVCLSAALDRELVALAPLRFFAQYFPPLAGLPQLAWPDELAGFLWYRRPPIDPAFLRRLTGRTVLDRFTVQRAPDPGASPASPSRRAPRARARAEVEPWLPDHVSALARLAEHTVYFAPRLYEGIGMGFLEAMALGLCVVAPDTPTHNEVIAHGVDGLLYSPARPAPLDLGSFRELGRRAREGAARRRAHWEAAKADLLDFLCTPKERLARGRSLVDFWHRSPAVAAQATADPLPAVTVVTVADDAAADLAGTLASVAEQDAPAREHLVVGGLSAAAGERPGVRQVEGTAAVGGYAAMAAALSAVTSEYVLFLPAGDRLVSPSSLRGLFAAAPREADVIHGHFVARDASGVEELRRIGELSRTLAELDERGFDPRWMERVPCLPATAFRTSLVRRHGFDPTLRFAADFDLHRRLARVGTRYHASDAVVALCRPEGAWARSLPLCAGEWLRLAVRHGAGRGARRLLVGLALEPVEAWEHTLWGRVDRIRGRHRRHFPAPSGTTDAGAAPRPPTRSRALSAGIQVAARRFAAAERWLAAFRPSRRAPASDEGEETYFASFADGIDFRRRGRPSFVARLAGISWPEEWGRWSDGPRVEIAFRRVLPRRARVELEAFAHPGVAGSPVEIAIGAAAKHLALDGEPFRIYAVELETSGREPTLVLAIPLPPAPARRSGEPQGERRRLGLALRALRVVDLEDSPSPAG